MHSAFRAISKEIDRTKSERMRAVQIGNWAAAALYGNEKAAAFCEREKIASKAQGGNTNTAGGSLVPDEVESAIIAYRNLSGVFRREANVRPMGSENRSFPRRVGGIGATFINENQQGVETEGAFDSVAVKAKKLMALTRASSELVEDELADLGEWLVEEFGALFADMEDDCGWNGDGSPAFGRMTGIGTLLADGSHAGGLIAASGHDTFPEIDPTDLGALVGALPEQYLANAKWYCSAYALGNCFVRLGAAAYGVTETPSGQRPMLHFGGFPIVATPKLPGTGDQSNKLMVAFGDLKAAAILGDRRGVTIKSSSTRYIEKDQIAFRGTERFEIIAHNVGDASKPGAVVGLIGN